MGGDPNGFAYDGIERPTRGFHATSAWKKTGSRAYESISKTNRKLQITVTRQISEDGDTMTVVNTFAGTGARTVSVWTRVGASTHRKTTFPKRPSIARNLSPVLKMGQRDPVNKGAKIQRRTLAISPPTPLVVKIQTARSTRTPRGRIPRNRL